MNTMVERYSTELGSDYKVEQGYFPMSNFDQHTAGYTIFVATGDYAGRYVFDYFTFDEDEAIRMIRAEEATWVNENSMPVVGRNYDVTGNFTAALKRARED